MAGRRLERIPFYIGHGYLLNGESGKHQPTSIVAVRATARCWKNGRTSGKGLERGLQICRDTAPLAGGVRDMRVESLALSGAGWQPCARPRGCPVYRRRLLQARQSGRLPIGRSLPSCPTTEPPALRTHPLGLGWGVQRLRDRLKSSSARRFSPPNEQSCPSSPS